MRPVLMGLVMVASLTTSLIGISVPRGVPPAVAMAQLEPFCGWEHDEYGRWPIDPEDCAAMRELEEEREREREQEEESYRELEEERREFAIGLEAGLGRVFGPGVVSLEECSAALFALLPSPEAVAQALSLGDGEVAVGDYGTLMEFFSDVEPQQFAADLAALGWRDYASQGYGLGHGGRVGIGIHRFETAEAAAQAVEYFIDLSHVRTPYVAGHLNTYNPVDGSLLAPNQWAFVSRDGLSARFAWLVQQDGTYVITVRMRNRENDPSPSALPQALLVMDTVQAHWLSLADGSRTGVAMVPGVDGPTSYRCDANYADAVSGSCVPGDRDYDCGELRSWGIADIPVIGEDWMLLDDDGDGWGCEPIVTVQEVQAAPTVVPTVEPTNQCDKPRHDMGCVCG